LDFRTLRVFREIQGKQTHTKLSVGQFFPLLIGWAHL
jgi:hypothetical protein